MKKKICSSFKTIFLSLMIFMATVQTSFAAVDIKAVEGILNGVVTQQGANQSNNPKVADRSNVEESIDPISGSLTLKQTDLTLTGKDGLDLSIARIYNSSQSESSSRKVTVTSSSSSWTVNKTDWHILITTYNSAENKFGTVEFGPYATQEAAEADCDVKFYYKDGVIGTAEVVSQVHTTYYTSYTITTLQTNEKYNYLRSRYDLGSGWALAFPSVQIEEVQGSKYIYYHDGTGGAYRVLFTADANDSNLDDYQGKDVKFLEDSGTYISADNVASKYKFISSDNRTTYFAADGRVLGTKDNLGNEIKFKYINRTILGVSYPYISSIIDSIGRTINFNYENTINDSTFNGEKITVTVNDPSNTKSLNLVYTKWRTLLQILNSDDTLKDQYYVPYLWSVQNPLEKNSASYAYDTYGGSKFDYTEKTLGSSSAITPYKLLVDVYYPNTTTNYQYEKAVRNLGPNGLIEAARVKTRYDMDWKYNSSANQWNEVGDNQHIDFSYNGDCSGYPTYSTEEAMPATYQFYSVATNKDGLKLKTVYNGSKQQVQTEATASNGEKKIVNNLLFDSRFKYKPTKVETVEKASDGTVARQLYTGMTYKDWGGIESTTHPLTASQYNDANVKQKYTVTYFYENPNFKYFVTKKQWYRDDSTLLSELVSYDSLGRLLTSTNAKGEVTNYNYSKTSEGDVIDITTNLENGKTAKTTKIYGPDAKYAFPTIVKEYYTDDKGVYTETKTTKTYNLLLGLIETEKDNNNKTTRFEYDNLKRIKKIILPNLTNIQNTSYQVEKVFNYGDGLNYSFYVDNENVGLATSWIYTATTYKKVGDTSTYYYSEHKSAYDGYGNLRQETEYDYAQGKWIATERYTYDSLGRQKLSLDAVNNSNSYSYDPWGRVSESTDSKNNLYKTEYDIKNNTQRVFFVAQANVTAYKATPTNDNLKENVVDIVMDQMDRPVERKAYPNWPSISGAISETYTYDIAGNLKTYTDAKKNKSEDGVTRTYSYDQLNRVSKVKNAINQVTEVSYTALGEISNVKLRENQNSTQSVELYTKTYNELGNITGKTDPSSKSDKYIYNALGLNTQMVDKNLSTFVFGYDDQNNIISDKATTQAGDKSNEYKYLYVHPLGAEEITDYTNNINVGKQINYYTPFGQIADKKLYYANDAYTSLLKNKYDDAGKITSTGVGKSSYFYTNYVYDTNVIDKVQTNGSSTVDTTGQAYADYEYYADGKLKSITYPKLADGSYLVSEYFYNKLNMLETVVNRKGSTILSKYSYTYDNNGNTEKVTDVKNNITTNYVYDKLDRLSEVHHSDGSLEIYSYDLRGNRNTLQSSNPILDMTNTSYTYDVRDRLTQVIKGTTTTDIKYRTDGLRYKKTSAGNTVQYHYNLAGKVVAESSGTGSITANYVWGSDRALVKKDVATGKEYYYLYNGHGDVAQMVDTSGNVVNSYQYDDWGNITSKTEGVANPFKYAGEILDDETGLYYLRARYYDPQIGRFINEDSYEGTVTNPASLNLYTYVDNNPLRYIDPSGHMKVSQFFGQFLPGLGQGIVGWDEIKKLVSGETFSGLWELAKNYDQINFSDLAKSAEAAFKEPFQYLGEHSKNVWSINGKPTNQEVFDYGKNLGNVITMLAGGGAAAYKVMQVVSKAAPKLAKSLSNIADALKKSDKFVDGFCFTEDTLVATKNGHKFIKDIKVGDIVYSINPETGEKGLKRVKNVFINETNRLIHIFIKGSEIKATPSHPFWVVDKGWIPAGELKKGDKLKLYSGEVNEVTAVESELLNKYIKVYNFEVEDWHTYYVSTNDVLVHNACFELPKARWINHDVWNELTKRGLEKKFQKAKDIGWAPRRKGTNGIIDLSENEIVKYKGNTYNFKIKVADAPDHVRVYGRIDENGAMVFDYMTKGK